MEIKYFRLIKTIVEEGNMANSAEKLFLTQSALSHQLKDLEERLGFKVFLRTRNRWELTEEGAELYKVGNEIPKILSNEIDIAITTLKPTNRVLSSIAVYEDEIFALMHRENALTEKEYLDMDDFAKIHLIIHSFPLETVSVYERFLKPNKITPLKISAVPLTEVALEMVSANMGILCLPKWALKSFKLSKDLVFKPISPHGIKRTHYLVFRTSDKSKKYMHDFIANYRDSFNGGYST